MQNYRFRRIESRTKTFGVFSLVVVNFLSEKRKKKFSE